MKFFAQLIFMIILSQPILAQNFTILEDNKILTSISHQLDVKKIDTIKLNGNAFLNFKSCYKTTIQRLGDPALPKFGTSILIPTQGDVDIEVKYDSYYDIQNVNITPSKGNLKRNVDPSKIDYQFGTIYTTDAFYPENLAEVSDPFILRVERGVNITVYPYQYNPVSKTLRVYRNIQIDLHYNSSMPGMNELKSKSTSKPYHHSFFLNENPLKYNQIEESGDLLIICPDSLVATLQPFVKWKNQKGIFTKIVGTSTTGNSANLIKNYIVNEYNTNPALLYLLLVGDNAEIPAYIYGNSAGEEIISDTYYGQLAGTDFYPELFVGRFSGNTAQIKNMVDRVLEYEKNPAAGDWMTNAIGIGSNEGASIGDDNEEDWQHIRNIKNQLTNFGYNQVYEFYDGTHGEQDAIGDPNSAIILPALNNGIGLLNYTGHGDINEMVTGSFTSLNVNNALNNGKYPFVVSVACNNGTFTYGTCLSETWLRASKNGTPTGAIGACGSSILMSWAPPMQTQDEMTEILTESYQNNKKITLGGLFYNAQLSMLENYPGADGDEVMQTWVLFGDPSTEFRNKITQELVVNHVTQINQNETTISVFCNEYLATIAISQNDSLLITSKAYIANMDFMLPILTSDLPLTVTVTKQNFKAYQGNIQVGNGPLEITENDFELISVFPNPTSDLLQIKIQCKSNATLTIADLAGKIIQSKKLQIGNSLEQIDLSALAGGIYQLKIESQKAQKLVKIIKN